MNITELARRLRVRPDELREKLPELGFDVGKRALKIDSRQAQAIMRKWGEMRRRERLTAKVERQKMQAEEREENRKRAAERPVNIPAVITVRDFASRLDLAVPRVMQELMRNGILAAMNERIDFDTASIIAEDLGFKAVLEDGDKSDQAPDEAIDRVRAAVENEKKEHLNARAPVVVVMGHVDHGKTRLLDAIRSTNVIDTEAGGITQHIGAYQVVRKERLLTFIDTPGHEAFTVMRSRGAKVADIAILVVAADDGVQPQTKEAINIIQSAGLPFMVALNKIDRDEANLDRVKGELAELKLTPEDWGGETVMVPISAKQGTNIDDLLDNLLLIAEMEQEKIVANPDRRAIGTVIESHVDEGTGPVATVLVQSGTLKIGDDLGVRESQFGRVRAMQDWKGDPLTEAGPSVPAKIIGWKFAPAVGDIMEVPENIKDLKKIKSTDRKTRATEEMATIQSITGSNESDEDEGGKKTLNLVIRADVLGSLEAILGMLDKVKHDDIAVKVVQKGLGNITESDIDTAEATGAIIVAFNTQTAGSAEEHARDKGVVIKEYSVIYKFFEDVLDELQKLLPSETVIEELGTCEVLQNFKKTDSGWIIGCKVKTGKIVPNGKIRLKRGEEYVGEGLSESLQLGRSTMKQAVGGQEFGMSFKGKVKPEEGDVIELYTQERKARTLVIEGIMSR